MGWQRPAGATWWSLVGNDGVDRKDPPHGLRPHHAQGAEGLLASAVGGDRGEWAAASEPLFENRG